MTLLEERMNELIPEAFERLIEGIEGIELTDSLQKTQFKQLKKEIKNLKLFYGNYNSSEFLQTKKWLEYSIVQLSNELPAHINVRFDNLFSLLKVNNFV